MQAGTTINSLRFDSAPALIRPFIRKPDAAQQGEVLALSGHCDTVIRGIADRSGPAATAVNPMGAYGMVNSKQT